MNPNVPEQVEYAESLRDFYSYSEKTSRFVVSKETVLSDVEAVITGNFIGPDNADISRTDSLANFINRTAQACPAPKYILVLSDHGDGYLPHEELPADDAVDARQTRGVVYDDGHDSSHFTAKTLAQVLSQASVRPSVVYCDACLMNTAECKDTKGCTDSD